MFPLTVMGLGSKGGDKTGRSVENQFPTGYYLFLAENENRHPRSICACQVPLNDLRCKGSINVHILVSLFE